MKKTVLENGLRIITKPLDSTQAVTVLILVGAGSRYENKAINGISHFLEHMFFKGAKKYQNTKEVSEAIDSVGGDFNAFTGKEYAGYYVKVAGESINVAVDVLADMLSYSKFDPVEIDKERGVILEEYNMYQDTPMYQVGWDFEKLLFGDQPLGWDQVGTKELINTVTQEQFQDYFAKLYTPDNTVIVAAGKVDHQWLVSEVQKLFKFKQAQKSLVYEPFKGISTSQKIFLHNKKTEQAHLIIGFPGYQDLSDHFYASRLLAVILGGNMSSRMFLNVREARGLAYYISTSTDEYQDIGVFSTSAGVSVERVEEAVQAIVAEYAKVYADGVTAEELAKAKAYLKGKVTLRFEDSEEYAHLLAKYELLHRVSRSPEEIIALIDQVELAEVNAVARDLLKPEAIRMALIGPFEDQQKLVELLKY